MKGIGIAVCLVLSLAAFQAAFASTLPPPASEAHENFYLYAVALMDQDQKDLYPVAIQQFARYIRFFPDNRFVDDCQFRIAKLYERSEDWHRAFFHYLKLIYFYPSSLRRAQALLDVQDLLPKLKIGKEKTDAVLPYEPGEKGDADRRYDFLQALWKLDNIRTYKETIEECNNFLYQYTGYSRSPEVQSLAAEIYLKIGEPRTAIMGLEREAFLFPTRADLPELRLRIAQIYLDNIKDVYQAKKNYLVVVREYAADPRAPQALLRIADIEAERERPRRPDKALDYLKQTVQEYPDTPYAVEALMKSAETFLKYYDDAKNAVRNYLELEERYPGTTQAPEALARAGGLYATKLRDFVKASGTYRRLAEKYPNYPDSPRKLFDAAEMQEKDLRNLPEARAVFTEVVTRFPDSVYAKKARLRLRKLEPNP
jgi:TolA-binding protein